MDADKAYGALALARAVEAAYARGETDYALCPMVREDESGAPMGRIKDGDSVVFCCRRGEREVELTEAFTDEAFGHFPRPYMRDLQFVIMTLYHEKFKNLPVAFAPERVEKPLADVLSAAGLRQYHLAESEKFAHVTFFFNGGANGAFPGEKDECVPSPRGVPFDQVPRLSLLGVEERLSNAMDEGYDFILTNFANGDVIGHTASKDAKLEAVAFVARTLERVVRRAKDFGYVTMVTADHGNIETLYTPEGKPHGAHTTNPVPFVVIDPKERPVTLKNGRLADVAPTVLMTLGLEKPQGMTGESLIREKAFRGKRVLLLVLDGWGIGSGDDGDAIRLGDTGAWCDLIKRHPHSRLDASGADAGLQDGKSGNSEAGHMNLGAGRVVTQDDVRMDNAIAGGAFSKNPVFRSTMDRARERGASLHLLSYLTQKSSHGSIEYPLTLLRMAEGVKNVYLHIIFDGRSTPPGSAPTLLKRLEAELSEIGRGQVVDGVGRGIALDRDGDYEKIRRVYEMLTDGTGNRYR